MGFTSVVWSLIVLVVLTTLLLAALLLATIVLAAMVLAPVRLAGPGTIGIIARVGALEAVYAYTQPERRQ